MVYLLKSRADISQDVEIDGGLREDRFAPIKEASLDYSAIPRLLLT